MRPCRAFLLAAALLAPAPAWAQASAGAQAPRSNPPSTLRAPSRADILRGEYGRYRANNDLRHYELDVRVDPERKAISGTNTIRFRMLDDDTRVQLELHASLQIEGITLEGKPLTFERKGSTVFVDFPETLRAGRTYAIAFRYSGQPQQQGRFGGLAFRKDPEGRHWINTANEGEGSSVWWPGKDQWRDEPDEGMEIRVAVPNGLTDVSKVRLVV
jgi:aminopeptidase N